MQIAVFGLGYVGCVSAACLAEAGHLVTGVDVDPHKVSLVASGRSPITEPGLDDLLQQMVAAGRIRVTSDATVAVQESELSLVCVGTPSRRNGDLETTYLERVAEQIGTALRTHTGSHVIAVRSTLLPGILTSRIVPAIERTSGRMRGDGFDVCVNPEFLREGSALGDFRSPPFTLVGELDPRAGDVLLEACRHLTAPVHRVHPDQASMVKYASNNFHALKVAFANEVGSLCRELGIDGAGVMRIFCEDRALNISPRYLRPGFGFGGSCLPKDLRAMVYAAKVRDISTPLLNAVMPSNDAHIQRAVDVVLDSGARDVALLGLSFKTGSDDLRESPFVRLAEGLIGKGVRLRIFDPDVALGRIFGRNRAYVHERLPHVADLFAESLAGAVSGAGVVIVAKPVAGIETLPSMVANAQIILDLAGVDALKQAVRPWSGADAAARGLSVPAET